MKKLLSLNQLTEANRRSATKRFLAQVRITDTCWHWTGATHSSGRGTITVERHVLTAPRFSYLLFTGDLPEMPGHHGACVCHSCDNPNCVNPDHLFVGSQHDNLRDMSAKQRNRPGRAPVFTDDQAIAIRRDPRGSREIAADYGVTQSLICNIKSYKSYKHIPPSSADVPVKLRRK